MHLPPGPTALLRRPAELLYAVMHDHRDAMARPTDRPWVRTGSGEALRFLFIGNGLAHGWGVTSHGCAPTGELARGVRAITGAACEVEFVGDDAMSAETAVEWLADRADTPFDGAVVAIGANDAMRLTPVADWGARLVNLLNAVQSRLPKGAPVILVGIPDVHVLKRVRPMNPIALAHARRLDAVAHRLAAVRSDVVHLPSPRLCSLVGQRPTNDLYAAFTLPIAAAVASAMRDAHVPASPFARGTRFDRPEVHAIVATAADDDLAALHSIARRAAAELHVTEAVVTLLDGERSWHLSSTASAPVAAPRAQTYCETVVATGEPLVVGDARRDVRFSENPSLHLASARFFAGVPVHAEDGTPIGAMCLLDDLPRSAASVDVEHLREFAREVEVIIRAATIARSRLAPAL